MLFWQPPKIGSAATSATAPTSCRARSPRHGLRAAIVTENDLHVVVDTRGWLREVGDSDRELYRGLVLAATDLGVQLCGVVVCGPEVNPALRTKCRPTHREVLHFVDARLDGLPALVERAHSEAVLAAAQDGKGRGENDSN